MIVFVSTLVFLLFAFPVAAELVTAESLPTEPAVYQQTEDEPEGTVFIPGPLTERTEAVDLFGGRPGFIHPFLSVRGEYTDNLFNEPRDEEDDFITIFSPGVWAAFPARDRVPLNVSTLNSAPGGLQVTRFPLTVERRLQGYALYRADITEHDRNTDEDNVYQRAEGLAGLNFRGGLSLELLDIFEIDQDPYSTIGRLDPDGTVVLSREVDEFTSNLLQFLVDYRFSPKTRARIDFGEYTLDYDGDRNDFRKRDDLFASLYFFYRFLPKTSVLLQYDYIDIDYDEDLLFDSQDQRVLAGFLWEATTRSRGTIKAGYGTRDLDGEEGRDDLVGEVRLDHSFTPKTAGYVQFTRRVEETDVQSSLDVLSHRLQIGLRQLVAARWSATADISYTRDSYRGEIEVDGEAGERKDDDYGARFNLGYHFRPWLNFGLGYSYLRRDSNFSDFEYSTNTVYLTITAAL